MRSSRWLTAIAVVAVIGGGGCGDVAATARASSVPPDRIRPMPADLVPARVLDLTAKVEDITPELAKARSTYVEAVSLYSLRRGELLEATLQATTLNGRARVNDVAYRRSFVNSLGGSEPLPLTLGDITVWSTTSNDQRLSVWFRGRHVFVLAVRKDYEHPRKLLRAVLGINP